MQFWFLDFHHYLVPHAQGNSSLRYLKWIPLRGYSKKKGDKTPCDSSSIASKLLPLLERWQLKPENPFFLIFRLYKQQFLSISVRKGLIDPYHPALADDGTPVRTSA